MCIRDRQWIDKEDWVYETCFTLAAGMMRKEHMELVFEGLDTYADVYLNDECILKADNMFQMCIRDSADAYHRLYG